MKLIKRFLTALFILALSLFTIGLIYENWTTSNVLTPSTDFSHEINTKAETEAETEAETIEGDLLGTGSKQKITISVGEREVKIEVIENGKVVASNVFDYGFVKPSTEYSLIKIDQNKSQEYLRWDQYVGPHHVETLILTTGDGIVRPALAADYENEVWYLPFWSSRDSTYIRDINDDGIAEVLEYADEFPSDAPRLIDPEIEKITRREFPDDLGDDMWRIVSRENFGEGRGRKVIWNVYTILNEDPLLFKKANKEEYEELTANILEAIKYASRETKYFPEVISRYDLSQESISFNNFVRDFWTQGFPYTEPF